MTAVPCRYLHRLNSSSLQCSFVKTNSDCQTADGFLNYLNFVYCDYESTYVPVIICCGWILILFFTIGSTVDDFFCPALEVIARFLKLSHNVAGVTFLAFGNGAPDIFSSIAGINQLKPDLVIGALFGAGIFVTCVVAGSIIIVSPFEMVQRPFLRDVIFYLSAVFWTFYLFYTGKVTIYHSIGFIILYIIYLIVVLVGHYIYQRWLKPTTLTDLIKKNSAIVITVASPSGSEVCQNVDEDLIPPDSYFWRRKSFERQRSHSNSSNYSVSTVSDCSINADDTNNNSGINNLTSGKMGNTLEVKQPVYGEHIPLLLASHSATSLTEFHTSEWKTFLLTICPINVDIWPEYRIWQKLLRLLSSPLILILKLTIPIVDHDKRNDNWCRSVTLMQCFVSPIFFMVMLGYYNVMIGSIFPLWAVLVIISILLSIVIIETSVNDQPPKYHVLFAFFGFIASIVWIYLIASEIVSVLKTIGVVLQLSDAILGLTILAWGNSLADLIADISLAKQELPRMGMSGCFGGPLFNLLLGIGIPFTILILKQDGKDVLVSYSQSITILVVFLCLSLASSLICIPAMKFFTHKSYGYYLIFLYLIFLILSICNECKIF